LFVGRIQQGAPTTYFTPMKMKNASRAGLGATPYSTFVSLSEYAMPL
jgi:hypothetical protein